MQTAQEFLATGQKFRLGILETEKTNPKTAHLSDLAKEDIPTAIGKLTEVDVAALEILKTKTEEILHLRSDILATWQSGGRVFLCGCGATGRLSMLIENLHLESASIENKNNVVAFMAGGDVALVHSLEGFEDFPEYGARHLLELGFHKNDLLISSSEGGETPYVIGATEQAAKTSTRSPYFLYCNPDAVLCANVERSRRVIENKKIKKINLTVGPMALSGSTRMQASTVLQLAIGFALLTQQSSEEMILAISTLQKYLRENAVQFLTPFIERESAEYLAERNIIYSVRDYVMTVFTDTTERAPTFSLTPFSHKSATRLLKLKPSLCYVMLPDCKTPGQAWHMLLHRDPRPLNWLDIDERTGAHYLEAFDFSTGAIGFRKWLTDGVEHSEFAISRRKNSISWRLQNLESTILLPKETFSLFEHTLLKMLINMHSTLVMGRINRYKSNIMTWVYPTNGKLIDRATRYVMQLLEEEGRPSSYEVVVAKIFELKKTLSANESIVLAATQALSGRSR